MLKPARQGEDRILFLLSCGSTVATTAVSGVTVSHNHSETPQNKSPSCPFKQAPPISVDLLQSFQLSIFSALTHPKTWILFKESSRGCGPNWTESSHSRTPKYVNDFLAAFDDSAVLLCSLLVTHAPCFCSTQDKTKVPKEYIVVGGSVVAAILMVLCIGLSGLTSIAGFAYPAYKSFQAIETKNKGDDTQWLVYWVIFALFSIVETFVGASRLPCNLLAPAAITRRCGVVLAHVANFVS